MKERIKAIPQMYKGIKFRSTLEARWAIVFNELGIEWHYEPEGFDIDGIRYVPDFVLTNIGNVKNLFVEVKGFFDEEDLEKIKAFGKEYPLFVVGDIPSVYPEDSDFDVFEKEFDITFESFDNGFPLMTGDYITGDGEHYSFIISKGKVDVFSPSSAEDGDRSIKEAYLKALNHKFFHDI
jgi:hypothetical protein